MSARDSEADAAKTAEALQALRNFREKHPEIVETWRRFADTVAPRKGGKRAAKRKGKK